MAAELKLMSANRHASKQLRPHSDSVPASHVACFAVNKEAKNSCQSLPEAKSMSDDGLWVWRSPSGGALPLGAIIRGSNMLQMSVMTL